MLLDVKNILGIRGRPWDVLRVMSLSDDPKFDEAARGT